MKKEVEMFELLVAHVITFAFLAFWTAVVMIVVVRGLKSESRACNVAIVGGLFLASILIYVFINATDMKGSFRDFFWFSLALLLCCCGTLVGDILFSKSTSSERSNTQKNCCGAGGCGCDGACSAKGNVLREGTTRKGGLNGEPTTPRPEPPKPQRPA